MDLKKQYMKFKEKGKWIIVCIYNNMIATKASIHCIRVASIQCIRVINGFEMQKILRQVVDVAFFTLVSVKEELIVVQVANATSAKVGGAKEDRETIVAEYPVLFSDTSHNGRTMLLSTDRLLFVESIIHFTSLS